MYKDGYATTFFPYASRGLNSLGAITAKADIGVGKTVSQ